MIRPVYRPLRRLAQLALPLLLLPGCAPTTVETPPADRLSALPAEQPVPANGRAAAPVSTAPIAQSPRAPATAHSAAQDELFLALRDAAKRNDAAAAAELAKKLSRYELPSYVDYFRLKPQLFDASGRAQATAPDTEIAAFIERWRGTAIADRMRNDWLLVLGKRRDWTAFDREYPLFALNDDDQVRCYALMSAAARGKTVADDARALLSGARNGGDGCVELVGALLQNKQFDRDDLRTQLRWAIESGQNDVAARLAALQPADGRGELGDDPVANLVRTVRNDPAAGAAQFEALSGKLSRGDQGAALASVALLLARKLDPQALALYKRQAKLGTDQQLSAEARIWKVRTALRAHDWEMVRQTIAAMPDAQRASDPAWTYWYGRALQAHGHGEQARNQFARLAEQFDFYGQLAREELGLPLQLPARTTVTNAEIEAARCRAGFARARKLYALNLRFEGNREWNWELRAMNDRELLAAAEFARQVEMPDRAVNSADKTKTAHDFTLRYLMPFRDQMLSVAQRVGIDPAATYGLIRQESRFITNAKSGVGASGLMQVMPTTGRWVAKRIGLPRFDAAQLNDRDTNLLIGSHYLRLLVSDLDGSLALAAAAYNAGPGRPRAWRATLPATVEGAIFAESIPFAETRSYVKNVLSNTTWYATLLTGQPQSLKARLGVVAPQPATLSALP